jgi:myo-inositol-1(or 4)-monophosphatase
MKAGDLDRALQAAVQAALAAGISIKAAVAMRTVTQSKSHLHDLVTEVDRSVELLISERLASALPGAAFLGEEGSTTSPSSGMESSDRPLWLVDPLDGTNNFAVQIPLFCVSIALWHEGAVQLGVVHDPMRDELFVAVRGRGARLGEQAIRVAPEETLSVAVVASHVDPPAGTPNLAGYGRVAERCRNVRSFGSAALGMAWVACGRLAGAWELALNPWDVGAGVVLVTEAGGAVTTVQGTPHPVLSKSSMLATNGRIHAELVGILAADGAKDPTVAARGAAKASA